MNTKQTVSTLVEDQKNMKNRAELYTFDDRKRPHMKLERMPHGILIGDKFLSISEALDLLQWLSEQRDALLLANQMEPSKHAQAEHKEPIEEEWTAAELEEIASEDEQILRMDF